MEATLGTIFGLIIVAFWTLVLVKSEFLQALFFFG